MRQLQSFSILALSVSLTGCASIGFSLDRFKSGSVTYPDEMEQEVLLSARTDFDEITIIPAVYEAEQRLSKPIDICLLYTSPSPRDRQKSRMPSSA